MFVDSQVSNFQNILRSQKEKIFVTTEREFLTKNLLTLLTDVVTRRPKFPRKKMRKCDSVCVQSKIKREREGERKKERKKERESVWEREERTLSIFLVGWTWVIDNFKCVWVFVWERKGQRQCNQIWRFLNTLETNFFTKVAQMFGNFLGYF